MNNNEKVNINFTNIHIINEYFIDNLIISFNKNYFIY